MEHEDAPPKRKTSIGIRKVPEIHEEPHEETFFELFYDLLLVVVFMKLAYLKCRLPPSFSLFLS